MFCLSEKPQEAAVVPPHVAFAVRPSPGYWEYVKVNANNLTVEGINATEYLKFKETVYDENWYHICSFVVCYVMDFMKIFSLTENVLCEYYRAKDENALEVDFGALEYSSPRLTLSSSIGKGMSFISKFLSSRLWAEKEAAKPLVEHLLSLKHHDDVRKQVILYCLSIYMYFSIIAQVLNLNLAEPNDQ